MSGRTHVACVDAGGGSCIYICRKVVGGGIDVVVIVSLHGFLASAGLLAKAVRLGVRH